MPRKTTTSASKPAASTAKRTVNKAVAAPIENDEPPFDITPPVVENDNAADDAVVQPKAKPELRVKRSFDPNGYVTVRNGFNGRLVYVSRRTGEKFVWDEFGAEQDMELQELKNAKSSYKAFFENNWFLFNDPEIISYLGIERYYAKSLSFDEFDELFTKTPEEMERRIAMLPNGQKQSLVYKAREMIANREIDSMRIVDTLERCLGAELIER